MGRDKQHAFLRTQPLHFQVVKRALQAQRTPFSGSRPGRQFTGFRQKRGFYAGAFATDVDKLMIFLPFAVCKVIREVSTEEKVTSFSEPRS
jgi:hypothetical protein